MEIKYSTKIIHAKNEGEYIIPNSRYKADGYAVLINTIFEFHGDFWHGNPKKYNENTYNPISKKTFGELYQKTIEREQQIRDLGYNLVVMWEHDWNNINKSIKILQRKFRFIHH
jgi:G:T-mismatch repair DNA endonuclease (very short patch repair protein)